MEVQEVETRFKPSRFCRRLFKNEEIYVGCRLRSPSDEQPSRGVLHVHGFNSFFSYKVDSLKYEKIVMAYNSPYSLRVRKGVPIPPELSPIIGSIHMLALHPVTRDSEAVFELLAHKVEMALGFDLACELLNRPELEWGKHPTPELSYSEVMGIEKPEQLYKSPKDFIAKSKSHFNCRLPRK